MFEVSEVPSMVLVHPHKMKHEVICEGLTPESMMDTVEAQNTFYEKMFEEVKLKAFRDIEDMVKSNPFFMFIKGT
jgi:hypothetical protein